MEWLNLDPGGGVTGAMGTQQDAPGDRLKKDYKRKRKRSQV